MKKNNFKPKNKAIKELASQFEADFNKSLPVAVRSDGSMIYKTFVIKQMKSENWGLFHTNSRELIDEYYLKTCALMAAKAYSVTDINKFIEIKRLDSKYWASHCDTLVYRKNIRTAKELERYLILLNKLEHSEALATDFQEQISRMFKWSFV